jgi:hypothetical protein
LNNAKFIFFGLLLILITLGCERALAPEPFLEIDVAAIQYRVGDPVNVRINNPTSRTYYIRRCGSASYRYAVVMRNTGQEPTIVKNDSCNSFNQQILAISPGDELQLAFTLTLNPGAQINPEASFRFQMHLFDSTRELLLPPDNESNQFTIARN